MTGEVGLVDDGRVVGVGRAGEGERVAEDDAPVPPSGRRPPLLRRGQYRTLRDARGGGLLDEGGGGVGGGLQHGLADLWPRPLSWRLLSCGRGGVEGEGGGLGHLAAGGCCIGKRGGEGARLGQSQGRGLALAVFGRGCRGRRQVRL